MQEKLDQVIPEDLAGVRLDLALVELFPDFSRARLQHWVKNGQIRVNGETWRSKDKVAGGENVALQYEPENAVETFQPESIPLDIVFEDDHLLVLNKPPGLVVHPGAGNEVDLPVFRAENPMTSVVIGAGKAISNPEFLKKVCI